MKEEIKDPKKSKDKKRDAKSDRNEKLRELNEAGMESFPASDPPAWNASRPPMDPKPIETDGTR